MKVIKLYNSKSLKIEEFVPIKEKEVTMYVCGPTVYDHIHIGNARPLVVFDTLKRLFMAVGYDVKYVSNYTDVDDKIINRSKSLNVSEKELSEDMIKAYEKIKLALNVSKMHKTPKVTETMDDIIKFIDELILSGNAYVVDGDVYFRINSLSDYGSLSHQNLEDLKSGARVEENSKKENPLDFVLWKETKTGVKWESSYSFGRPGWHSECVVMIKKELGNLIDIHAGGSDLRFPHHENERIQAKALYGSELANYWLHNGMLTFGGEKMSKSLGNLISAKEAVEKFGANLVRWLLLSSHYRDALPFTDESIKNAGSEILKIETALKQANVILSLNSFKDEKIDEESYDLFLNQLSNDLNTPNAYTVIFDTIKKLNILLRNKEYSVFEISKYQNSILKMLDILGIDFKIKNLDNDEKKLYLKWQEFKQAKNFKEADLIRELLIQKGII